MLSCTFRVAGGQFSWRASLRTRQNVRFSPLSDNYPAPSLDDGHVYLLEYRQHVRPSLLRTCHRSRGTDIATNESLQKANVPARIDSASVPRVTIASASQDPPSFDLGPLTVTAYHRLKDALVRGRSTDGRDLLICELLFNTGLRISELLRIRPVDVRQQGPETELYVLRGKRRGRPQYTLVPLRAEVGARLQAYLLANRTAQAERVFRISDRHVRRLLAEGGHRALGYPVRPHDLRKLYCKWLLDNGVPLAAVAHMVGHVDTRTTARWYYDLTADQRRVLNSTIPV